MTETSDRFHLPLLAAGQAQKELTHNEALAMADILVHPVVQSVGPATIPAAPVPGQSWIVGASPTGAWAGQAGKIVNWTSGGWRFVAPIEGMRVWSINDSMFLRFEAGLWALGIETATKLKIGGNQVVGARQAAILAPTGGTIVDIEARAAIALILGALRNHGLIQP
jgi:Protein of unknown function (DUF2793)